MDSKNVWKEYLNILDEEILDDNMRFAMLFILNFECLKEFLISQMKEIFSNEYELNNQGELELVVSDEYREQVRKLDPKNKNPLTAALLWFESLGAINQEEIELFNKIRFRRNEITHELLENLMKGFCNDDIELFRSLLELYRKVDKWWINQVEIPLTGEDIPDEYDANGVKGSQAFVLELLNDIVLGKKDAYKTLIEYVRKKAEQE